MRAIAKSNVANRRFSIVQLRVLCMTKIMAIQLNNEGNANVSWQRRFIYQFIIVGSFSKPFFFALFALFARWNQAAW